ncbi:hypothetical protein B4119_3470 [Parageobacillus caldoxylosilyticus]|uniref:Uncharacterized protein n=1 Tax=Saccharococcus caldoxylosilyticus TaxID=81408 RepID=A0A150L6N3_9BACL|nr:hypothetical protein B4119_3470 [Parageobacillus caldoxylosilyticus]
MAEYGGNKHCLSLPVTWQALIFYKSDGYPYYSYEKLMKK